MQRLRVVNNVAHPIQPNGKEIASLDGRLRGGAEHNRGAVVARQLIERGQGRFQQLGRQRLRLVEDDHALGQAVKLAAARCAVGEQRLEQLHVRRHDEWRIEVLSR